MPGSLHDGRPRRSVVGGSGHATSVPGATTAHGVTEMTGLFYPVLFLHVLGAIVALGPALAFPVIGGMAGREPMHGNFATRVTHVLDSRVVLPFFLVTGLTGIALIWIRAIPLFEPAYRWLLLSIVLYGAALAFSWFVQRPTVLRVIALTGGFPGAGASPAAPQGPVGAGGPPPGLMAATVQTRRNGMILTLLSIAVVFLMVLKPSLSV